MADTTTPSPQIDSNFTLNRANTPPTINATITLTDLPQSKIPGILTDIMKNFDLYLTTLNDPTG